MAGEIAAGSITPNSIKDHHVSSAANIARTKMGQRVLGADSFPLEQCRVWDARQTPLPGTPATDDLGYVTGTLGTDMPSIQTGDLKAAGATTRYLGLTIPVPEDFEAAETVTLRIVAGMKTTIADGLCVVDAVVYRNAEDGSVGSDLCNTAAQSMNSLVAANIDFEITPTTLLPGDTLDVRILITCTDTSTVTAVIGRILAIKLLSDRR